MTVRSIPVPTCVAVTVTPGSTPPEVSVMVPSIVPFAAVDCAYAGALNAIADRMIARKYFSMRSSIPRFRGAGRSRIVVLSAECERRGGGIQFTEVLPEHHAAGEIR